MPVLEPWATWPVRLLRICQIASLSARLRLRHLLPRPSLPRNATEISLLIGFGIAL